MKYPCSDSTVFKIKNDIDAIEQAIEAKYQKLVDVEMPYGLDQLWNNKASATFAVDGGKALRDTGQCVEALASFVVRWAAELYSEWATWIKYLLPGVSASY